MDLFNAEKTNAPFRPGMSATVDVQTKKANNVLTVPIQAVTTRSDSSEFKKNNKKMDKGEENGPDGIVIKDEKNKSKDDSKETIKVEECVFLYVDGKAKLVKVKAGIQDNNYIEIKEGLKEGDEIISGPYGAVSKVLKEGSEVKKVDKAELFTAPKK